MLVKQKEKKNYNRVMNTNWREANQLVIYMYISEVQCTCSGERKLELKARNFCPEP